MLPFFDFWLRTLHLIACAFIAITFFTKRTNIIHVKVLT